MITEEEKRSLERLGYSVIYETNLSTVKRYNTNIFVRIDGRLIPYYDSLRQIPPLQNGEQFLISHRAFPEEIRDWDKIEAYIHNLGSAGLFPVPIWIVGLIIVTVLTAIVFIGTYYIMKATDTRCGTTAEIKDISECLKIIIAPDCSIRTYNPCTNQWEDEEWHKPTPPPSYPVEFIKWLIIGGIAVVGLYFAVKYIPTIVERLKRK